MSVLTRQRFAIVTALVFLVDSRAAWACAICRCVDPTFNALGNNVYSSGQFHVALDWDGFEKSQSTADHGSTGTDGEVDNRFTAAISYSIAERVVAVVRLPYSSER